MKVFNRTIGCSILGRCAVAVALAVAPAVVRAQALSTPVAHDSVTVVAGAHYRAGGLYRFLFGGTYRRLWTTSIRVAVLDLHSFAGGLRPKKEGGGHETRSLRFVTAGGVEYVFRSVDKEHATLAPQWKGTPMEGFAFDQFSSTYPAAPVMAAPMLEAAGVLQTPPVLVVMPDDALLGKFRADYAGRLGTIELSPSVPKHAPAFAGAVEIIDSDTLLQLLDRDPTQRVDAPALLAARLMDMLLNDWDRHPGQWKWARIQSGPDALWEPIPRDRDYAFSGFSGLLPGLAGLVSARLPSFAGAYPSIQGLTRNSLELDRRLLTGLAKPVWDSVARALTRSVTDASIDAAVRAMPAQYQALAPQVGATLRRRRDTLPEIANRFYLLLASVVDIHATDVADRATVTRGDGFVEVRLESGNGPPYFRRRFDTRETREIRLYLHGGDDSAIVVGHVAHSIPVRIIGGNGANRLIDSSTVGSRRDPTHRSADFIVAAPPGGRSSQRPRASAVRAMQFADPAHLHGAGTVSDESYGPDTLFNRRPLVREFGKLVPQGPDHGGRLVPIAGISDDHDFGVAPRLGMTRYRYGFGDYPYASMVALDGRYSFRADGWKVGLSVDERRENSPVHFTVLARMSQLEILNFHGFGNATPETPTDFFAVHERQWLLQPVIALALAPGTDLSLGPALQYSVTDDTPDHFVSLTEPYGFGSGGRFGEASLRLSLHRDTRGRMPARWAQRGMLLDVTGAFFPAVWDVTRTFEAISAATTAYFNLSLPMHPNLTLRAGGKRVFGGVPFQEAAFIGGNGTLRTLDLQRYAGDAALYAGAELRIPLAQFGLIVPLHVGLLATEDVGRVYLSGDSPGGWHNVFGAGFWVAFNEVTIDLRVIRVAELGRPPVITLGVVLP